MSLGGSPRPGQAESRPAAVYQPALPLGPQEPGLSANACHNEIWLETWTLGLIPSGERAVHGIRNKLLGLRRTPSRLQTWNKLLSALISILKTFFLNLCWSFGVWMKDCQTLTPKQERSAGHLDPQRDGWGHRNKPVCSSLGSKVVKFVCFLCLKGKKADFCQQIQNKSWWLSQNSDIRDRTNLIRTFTAVIKSLALLIDCKSESVKFRSQASIFTPMMDGLINNDDLALLSSSCCSSAWKAVFWGCGWQVFSAAARRASQRPRDASLSSVGKQSCCCTTAVVVFALANLCCQRHSLGVCPGCDRWAINPRLTLSYVLREHRGRSAGPARRVRTRSGAAPLLEAARLRVEVC